MSIKKELKNNWIIIFKGKSQCNLFFLNNNQHFQHCGEYIPTRVPISCKIIH